MKSEEELLRKIAELENKIRELSQDLIHDPLTGLYTRKFLENELHQYLTIISHVNSEKRRQWFGFEHISILFFDVDNFKAINDTYGHLAGDIVLKDVADVIRESVREGDTAARWGGEEVVVMLLGAAGEDAREKAENIRRNVENLSFDFAPELKVTVSGGISEVLPKMTQEEIIKQADTAMYRAKEAGRNKVVAYSELGE